MKTGIFCELDSNKPHSMKNTLIWSGCAVPESAMYDRGSYCS